ncbi:MAG: hypothetical protein AAFX79_12315 [Planctomycetota bacterium]
MNRRNRVVPIIAACMMALIAREGLAQAPAQPSDAAADAEARIAELEARVAALEEERSLLVQRLADAVQMLRNLGFAAPPQMAPEPVDPLASPNALLHTLRRRAAVELGGMPRATQADRLAYDRAASEWIEKANQGLAGERRWLVRVLGVTMPTSGSSAARAAASVQIFDPASGRPLSLPTQVATTSRMARRLADEDAPEAWLATVRVAASVVRNPARTEPGPFDYPPYLAPEVEATVRVEWRDFQPAEVPEGFFDADAGEPDAVAPPPAERASVPR